MQKKQLETLLKINGLSPSAPDEKIRSILLSARFKEDEIKTAITVLRENVKTNIKNIEGLHKVFRSDRALKSKEISELLGIDVDITETVTAARGPKEYTAVNYMILWFISVVLAVSAILFYMYVSKVGIFYPVDDSFRNL